MTDFDIERIKSYYKHKKEEWAKTKTYYSTPSNWGDNYGYQLAEPYTLEELESKEQKANIRLDPYLKRYLTQVSRELFISSYPIKFGLSDSDELECRIPINETRRDEDCLIHKDMEECDETCSMWNGMCQIGEGGCQSGIYMVVKGNHLYSIWYATGDSLIKDENSFKDLINKQINK